MCSVLSPVSYTHLDVYKRQVWAGLEPLDFTNLFPEWTDRDDIAEINIKVSIKQINLILKLNFFLHTLPVKKIGGRQHSEVGYLFLDDCLLF